jgi:hypothetical protein
VQKATITVERVLSLAGFQSVFRVMLDGRQVAVIPPGRMRTVKTVAGNHELCIRIRRRKMSRTLSFHLDRDDAITVRCGRPRTGVRGPGQSPAGQTV